MERSLDYGGNSCRLEFDINSAGTLTSLSPFISDHEWDLGRIAIVLGHSMSAFVLRIPICSELPDDRYTWGDNSSPNPRIRDFYLSIQCPEPQFAHLARIWKIQCPETTKLMVWKSLLGLGKLPTASFPLEFRMLQMSIEDLDHLFFHCPFAASVWGRIRLAQPSSPRLFSFQDLKSLLLLQPRGRGWNWMASLAVSVIWHLWCSRNRLVFDGKHTSPLQVSLQALATFEVHRFPSLSAPAGFSLGY